jgi:hypothetical protein
MTLKWIGSFRRLVSRAVGIIMRLAGFGRIGGLRIMCVSGQQRSTVR